MPINTDNILHLSVVDSTNNYAMALIEDGLGKDEMIVVADEQSGGKGRRGNSWLSNKRENVTLSLILSMNWLPLKSQFELSAAISVGLLEFFETKTKEKVFIKWPNDIFINDSKAAGILIENKVKGTLWQWAVVGVGCNINQVHFENVERLNITSLKKVTGRDYSIEQIVLEIKTILIEKINAIKQGRFLEILDQYNQRLYGRGEKVVFLQGNNEIETIIKRITSEGNLVAFNGTEAIYDFDEIKFLRKLS